MKDNMVLFIPHFLTRQISSFIINFTAVEPNEQVPGEQQHSGVHTLNGGGTMWKQGAQPGRLKVQEGRQGLMEEVESEEMKVELVKLLLCVPLGV